MTCIHCGAPATCVGAYEASEIWEPACDECCGHGCEDGQCYPLDEIPSSVAEQIQQQLSLN